MTLWNCACAIPVTFAISRVIASSQRRSTPSSEWTDRFSRIFRDGRLAPTAPRRTHPPSELTIGLCRGKKPEPLQKRGQRGEILCSCTSIGGASETPFYPMRSFSARSINRVHLRMSVQHPKSHFVDAAGKSHCFAALQVNYLSS